MPGYGQSQLITCEILDDNGNVLRSMPLPADKRGKLPMTAKQVQEWSGLTPVKAKRGKAKAAAVPEPATPTGATEPAQAIEASEAEPVPDAPMFSTIEEFKRAATIGTQWRKALWQDGAWDYAASPQVRTVARVQSRDLAFAWGACTPEQAEHIGRDMRGALAWLGIPKRGAWKSDARGLILLDREGAPFMRFDPIPIAEQDAVPMPETPAGKTENVQEPIARPPVAVEPVNALSEAPSLSPEPVSPRDELPEPGTVKECLTVEAVTSPDPIAAIEARLAALEAAMAALPAEPVADRAVTATPVADSEAGQDDHQTRPKRTVAHERAIRRAWAERRNRREAATHLRIGQAQYEAAITERDAARKAATSLQGVMAERDQARASAEAWERSSNQHWRELERLMDKRTRSAQRARRMIAAARAATKGQHQAACMARFELAKLRRDLADPTQPERASDIARLVQERDQARTACAALERRAAAAETARDSLADRFEDLVSRVTRAEAALRAVRPAA